MAGHAGLVQKKVNVRGKRGVVARTMWVKANKDAPKLRPGAPAARAVTVKAKPAVAALTPGARRKRTAAANKRKASSSMDEIINKIRGDRIISRVGDAFHGRDR